MFYVVVMYFCNCQCELLVKDPVTLSDVHKWNEWKHVIGGYFKGCATRSFQGYAWLFIRWAIAWQCYRFWCFVAPTPFISWSIWSDFSSTRMLQNAFRMSLRGSLVIFTQRKSVLIWKLESFILWMPLEITVWRRELRFQSCENERRDTFYSNQF